MDKNFLNIAAIVIVIAVVSALLVYWRAEHFGAVDDIANRGLSTVRREAVLFYGVLPLFFGGIAWFAYKAMYNHSPQDAQTYFLLLALGLGVVFTVMAAMVFKMRGFSEFVTLHLIYLAGFGWVLPRVLTL